MALAQVGYCALFGFLGLFTRRSLIAGIAYIVAIEGVLANLDFVGRVADGGVLRPHADRCAGSTCRAEQLRRCQEVWGMTDLDEAAVVGRVRADAPGVRGGGVGAVGAVVRPQRVPREDAGQRLTACGFAGVRSRKRQDTAD